jgi:hypothetical protein
VAHRLEQQLGHFEAVHANLDLIAIRQLQFDDNQDNSSTDTSSNFGKIQ